ncbi:hypothetical protein [Virgibacillus kimchii]
MTNKNDYRMKIKKEKEMRTKGISRMIDEGGLGAEKYYEIIKSYPPRNTEKYEKQEAR